ncbi:MAG TPA: SOS response-associated peptidase [Opitutales bacterium]|nr:SOS response-associated peptidase [Opitutales bacterium]
MCGRITLREPRRAVSEFLETLGTELPPPRYNIGPGQETLIVRAGEAGSDRRELSMLHWGLVPAWKRDGKTTPIINARSETVAVKPIFREAFRHRRCLLLADGFYEWKKQGGERQPFFCTLVGDQPFAIAAIWEEWQEGGSAKRGFCLLTTEANALMEPVHHRMPVLFTRKDAARWLAEGARENLTQLLRPFPASAMEVRAVSSFVNKIGNEGPDCIAAPSEGGSEQLTFF